MAYKPESTSPFVRGIVASSQPLAQPKGSVPRASNMLLTSRGAMNVCDGSAIVEFYKGAIQTNRGRFMAVTLFTPTGVSPYYMALQRTAPTEFPLGPPLHLTGSAEGTYGTLPSGTYYYKVTALDGVGGETTASNEVAVPITLGQNAMLTWNVVPNAWGYNVYRGTAPGGESLITGTGLPVPQPAPLTPTVTFIDTGEATAPAGVSIVRIAVDGPLPFPQNIFRFAVVTLTAPTNIGGATTVVIAGNSNSLLNGTFGIYHPPAGMSSTFTMLVAFSTPSGTTGTGGTATIALGPPTADTTIQTALFQFPQGTDPVTYTNANIVALFPASPAVFGTIPSGGEGG